MKNDKKIENLMKKLEEGVIDWNKYVENFNQCAYTDRKLEQVIKIATKIKELNEGNSASEVGEDSDDGEEEVYYQIVTSYKNDLSGVEYYDDYCDPDDARRDYKYIVEGDAENLKYAVLRKITVDCCGQESIEEIATFGELEK